MSEIVNLLLVSSWQTIYIVLVSVCVATVFGIPFGILLLITDKGHILENGFMNKVLGTIVNIFRSIPFIILIIVLIPFTRFLVGTSIGTTAAIVPLSIAAIPFMGRLMETSLREVDWGIIEAAQAMGSSRLQIITKVLVSEALPSIVSGITITTIVLIEYSAIAGVIGGGGLGDLAIRYGYQRFMPDIMLYTVIILVVMVQLTQMLGDFTVKQLSRNR